MTLLIIIFVLICRTPFAANDGLQQRGVAAYAARPGYDFFLPYEFKLFFFRYLFQSRSSTFILSPGITPVFWRANNADRIERSGSSARKIVLQSLHFISGAAIPRSCRIFLRNAVMREQKSARASHEISGFQNRLSSSSISGNQALCASPDAMSFLSFFNHNVTNHLTVWPLRANRKVDLMVR